MQWPRSRQPELLDLILQICAENRGRMTNYRRIIVLTFDYWRSHWKSTSNVSSICKTTSAMFVVIMASMRQEISDPGSPAILGSFVASREASRRKRGPVALRHWLSLDLPLSHDVVSPDQKNCQFGKILETVRFGSVAVVQADNSPMTALGWNADI